MQKILNKYGVLKNRDQPIEDHVNVESLGEKINSKDEDTKSVGKLVEGNKEVL